MAGTVNLDAPGQVDSRRATALRWLWPPRCLACGDRGERHDLCRACAASLPRMPHACLRCALPLADAQAPVCGGCLQAPPPLAEVHAAFLYSPPLDRLLPRFKFHHDLAAGRLLAELMADALRPLAHGRNVPPVLVPVPLHRARLRQRGYDQALELARPLARALRLPLRDDLLVRRRATAPQSQLDADQRQRNLRRAFDCVGGELPAHVVLVDDVMTTGATLHAAAGALRRGGVARVDAWVCARVP